MQSLTNFEKAKMKVRQKRQRCLKIESLEHRNLMAASTVFADLLVVRVRFTVPVPFPVPVSRSPIFLQYYIARCSQSQRDASR